MKGAGAPAEPAARPLTLFNTLITVPKECMPVSSSEGCVQRYLKTGIAAARLSLGDKVLSAFRRELRNG